MKNCKKCKVQKPFTDFYKSPATKDGLQGACKVCNSAEARERYLKNRERVISQTTEWNRQNKDKHKIYKQKYVETNAEKIRSDARERWRKRYYADLDVSRDAARVREQNRRSTGRLSKAEWDAICSHYKNDKGEVVCPYCETVASTFHMEHFIPVSKGGKTEPSNVLPSCVPCNRYKSNKLPQDYLSAKNYDRLQKALMEACHGIIVQEV